MLMLVTGPQARPSAALQELQAGDGPHRQSVSGDPSPKYQPSFQDETCSGCFAKVPISRQGKLRPREDEQIGKAKRPPGADGEVNSLRLIACQLRAVTSLSVIYNVI